MKLPSLEALARDARATLLRFPFVLIIAAIGTVDAISEPDDPRIILTCLLGIPLLFSIAVLGERRGWSRLAQSLGSAVGIALLVGYYLTLPSGRLSEPVVIHFLVLALGLHFLVAFAPFVVSNQLIGFWQYNRRLFLRMLAGLLYTGVLYLGLALALFAVDKLLGIVIRDNVYGDLALILFGMFNTWFFLGGVPRDFAALEDDASYPGGLKIFTQYVLLPLVVVYLVILYLYSARILLEWNWPEGWVSTLILSFAVVGILSSLLLYPVRNREGNTWIARFYAWFYYALLPLTVLLVLAIMRRISEYGVTEERYYVLTLAFWLAGIAVYMLITRGRDIRMIPVSLAVLSFLSAFGPWGALQVSVDSQIGQLREILEAEGAVVGDRFTGVQPSDTSNSSQRIRSVVHYLDEHRELSSVAGWFGFGADTVSEYDILGALGFEIYESGESALEDLPAFRTVSYSGERTDAVDVTGYERLVRFEYWDDSRTPRTMEFGGDTLRLWSDRRTDEIYLMRGPDRLLSIGLREFAGDLRREFGDDEQNISVPPGRMVVTAAGNGFAAKVMVRKLYTVKRGSPGGPEDIGAIEADVLIRRGPAGDAEPESPAGRPDTSRSGL